MSAPDGDDGTLATEDTSSGFPVPGPDAEFRLPDIEAVTEVHFDDVEEPSINPPAWDLAPAIVVSDVAKWYDSRNLGRLRSAMPFRPPSAPPEGAIIALDGADVEIGEAQSVGIIGNNGAGKSTMLKLIAGVTSPSRGEVRVKGPVASMIELGLGFHPEMTGTENLFYAAALLGMSRRTVLSRWDDIIEFSGVAHALEQPVKQYSSGMLARLGFALASHSDAEIILVDEVLSVGDFDFQRRSLERIMRLNREGRTTVIVTHMLGALPPLCHRIIQLEKGRVVADGTPGQVIPDYVAQEQEKYAAHGNDSVHISQVEVVPRAVHPSGSVTVRGVIETSEPLDGCRAVVRVGMGQALIAWAGESEKQSLERLVDEPLDIKLKDGPGRWEVEATIESLPFFPGDYMAGLAVLEPLPDMTEIVSHVVPLDVLGEREDWKSIRVKLAEQNRRVDLSRRWSDRPDHPTTAKLAA